MKLANRIDLRSLFIFDSDAELFFDAHHHFNNFESHELLFWCQYGFQAATST